MLLLELQLGRSWTEKEEQENMCDDEGKDAMTPRSCTSRNKKNNKTQPSSTPSSQTADHQHRPQGDGAHGRRRAGSRPQGCCSSGPRKKWSIDSHLFLQCSSSWHHQSRHRTSRQTATRCCRRPAAAAAAPLFWWEPLFPPMSRDVVVVFVVVGKIEKTSRSAARPHRLGQDRSATTTTRRRQ